MNKVTRRRFVGTVAAGAAGIAWDNPLFAQSAGSSAGPYDLVAVRNGGAVEMFEAGIKALGGMARFVKAGQRVVVKPNIAWDKPPEIPANTNPELVAAVVNHCRQAGAARVIVFDHTCHNWEKTYVTSGIADAVKAAGGEMVAGNLEEFYRDVSIDKGKSLKSTKVHREYLDADVCINMPVLKHHGGAKLSLAMKNLMGVVWERRTYHDSGLDQCIADFCLGPKLPALNIIDAYRILRKNGPQGKSVDDGEIAKYQILGTDIVAVDAAAVKLFGAEVASIGHVRIAGEMGVGQSDLAQLKMHRITL
jgi:uncharacterized protein (DUF362 family)